MSGGAGRMISGTRAPALVTAVLIAVAYGCGESTGPAETIETIEVAPANTTLVSLGEAVGLTATARDASGDQVDAGFEWSSSNAAAAEIDGDGQATAVANGTATISATAGGVSGAATVVVAQAMDAVQNEEGNDQVGAVGMPLDTLVRVRALDAGGSPIPGIALAFAASAGSSVDAEVVTTDAEGIAEVQWTLGTTPGLYELTVTEDGTASAIAVATATGLAAIPASMVLMGGDAQTELPERALPAPIQVKIVDEFDNPVVGLPVEFSVQSGGGTVDPAEAVTDLTGVASAIWTLGPGMGEQAAQALVRDSVVEDPVDLLGSPVTFSATAVAFALNDVTPEPAPVGGTITLEGTGFGPELADNEVQIDGVLAPMVNVSQTSLTAEVPSFGCAAARPRTIEVIRGTNTAAVEVAVVPAGFLDLAVGERVVVEDPVDYCLQFAASEVAGPVDYLIGLTSTRAWNASASFTVTANSPSSDSIVPAAGETPAGATVSSGAAGPVSPEAALRAWERDFLSAEPRISTRISRAGEETATISGASKSQVGVPSAASVGSDEVFRVPDVVVDPCNAYVAQPATVVHVGEGLVVAAPEIPDQALSAILNDDEIAAALAALQNLVGTIRDRVSAYIGDQGESDADGRVTVLLTPALNDANVPPAFSTAVDLADRAVCPASDEQMMVYVTIPDVNYAQPQQAIAALTAAMDAAPPDIAHEVTHILQNVTRISNDIASPLPIWLAEGQAELLVEVVGRNLRGDAAGMDYGADVVDADAIATAWYLPRFERLSYLFGWDGASGRVAGAPEQCSLFGFGGFAAPCAPESAPGAAWSFVRFLTDRIALGMPDGEAELHRALVLLENRASINAFLETRTASETSELIVDWATMLYTDGRLSDQAAPDLQLASWDLADIYAALPAERRLEPDEFDFEAFTREGGVVGGGTVYLRLTAADDHDALAVRVRDALGQALSPDHGTRLWVVRMQ